MEHEQLKNQSLEQTADLLQAAGSVPQSFIDLLREVASKYVPGKSGACMNCSKPVYYYSAPYAFAPGHIYSEDGRTEFKISSCCEFCFDHMFNEREIEKLREYSRTHKLEHPMPGQVLHYISQLDKSYEELEGERERIETFELGEANSISSMVRGKHNTHKLIIDLDHDAKLIPSSTPGHFHLYVDKEIPQPAWETLLEALAEAGIIEEGYKNASLDRGYTTVRLPWIKKEETQ